MSNDRRDLRTSFDSAADLYQLARPEYPEALYDALIETAELNAGDRLLEIGCGQTGETVSTPRSDAVSRNELMAAFVAAGVQLFTSRGDEPRRLARKPILHWHAPRADPGTAASPGR